MAKDGTTNDNFWDCECIENYIHSKKIGNCCPKCGTHEAEQPDSIISEIQKFYNPKNDIATKT